MIPAAGSSERMGTGVDKQLLSLCGRTVLERSVLGVAKARWVGQIVLVVRPGRVEFFQEWCRGFAGLNICVVAGGSSRQGSVYKGLAAVSAAAEIVIVHDGARPLVEPVLVDAVAEAAVKYGAATAGVPAKDTVKVVGSDGRVEKTLPRDGLWLVQTPQAFRRDIIERAHERALEQNINGTDDASLVEECGWPVFVVSGSYSNIKITTPEDIIVARALLEKGGGE